MSSVATEAVFAPFAEARQNRNGKARRRKILRAYWYGRRDAILGLLQASAGTMVRPPPGLAHPTAAGHLWALPAAERKPVVFAPSFSVCNSEPYSVQTPLCACVDLRADADLLPLRPLGEARLLGICDLPARARVEAQPSRQIVPPTTSEATDNGEEENEIDFILKLLSCSDGWIPILAIVKEIDKRRGGSWSDSCAAAADDIEGLCTLGLVEVDDDGHCARLSEEGRANLVCDA